MASLTSLPVAKPIEPTNGNRSGSIRPERIDYPENRRYRRVRTVSVLMDQSIVLPSGYRIGLDPILGLVPGLGDVVTSLVSCYLVYECALLGLPKRILFRMLGNIAVESLAGSFPVLGDIFDVFWKSNMRNLRLLEQHYHPTLPERSARRMALWMAAFAAGLVLMMGTAFYLIAKLLLVLASYLVPF